MLKTLCTANAGHARMPDERFGSVVLVVEQRLLCAHWAAETRASSREGTGNQEIIRARMTNQRKNNYKDDESRASARCRTTSRTRNSSRRSGS